MDLDVSDVPDQSRYEARADGAFAGYLSYHLNDRQILFTHTVMEPGFEGQGIGNGLVSRALDDVRSRQLGVATRCSFVRAFLDRHPEYADLERQQ